jgi:hypothetical protein
VNKKIRFSYLVNNGIISQKYLIGIAFKLCFKEIFAKEKKGQAVSYRDSCPSAQSADRRLVKKIRYAPRSSLDRQSLAGTDTH